MFGIHDFTLFVVAGVLVNLTPGQDTFYILGKSATQGRRAGVLSALGIGAGGVVHTVAASLGLSALIAASAKAYFLIKIAGALYLIYLGACLLLRSSQSITPTGSHGPSASWSIFRQGLLTNVLNPKVALFFLAFLPQFIEPTASLKSVGFVVLGLCFVTTGTFWCLVLAYFGSYFGAGLHGRPRLLAAVRRTVGGLFIYLGIRLAAAE